ncbi:Mur ligase domain-containing protein, partial [Actinotalea ferrariae]|uniref:Mur ligase domain-containing protein n=1 Tax=Actinotalea ferrariae TaxID=1386098 RepID=UPI001FE02039
MTSPHGRMRPRQRPARHLGDLAAELGVPVPAERADVVLTGVAVGSADVEPGDLFAALPGAHAHGADFAAAAAAAG